MNVNWIRNNQGISTVAILIFSVLGIFAAMIALQTLDLNRKEQVSLKDVQDFDALMMESRTILQNPYLCEQNLKGKIYTASDLANGIPLLSFSMYDDHGLPTSVLIDFSAPKGKLHHLSARLYPKTTPLGTGQEWIIAHFSLTAERTKGESMGSPVIERFWPDLSASPSFGIVVQKVTGTSNFEIKSCELGIIPTPVPTPTCNNPTPCDPYGEMLGMICCPTYSCTWSTPHRCQYGCSNPLTCTSNSDCCTSDGFSCVGGHCILSSPSPTPTGCQASGDVCQWFPTTTPPPGSIPTHNCCSGLACALGGGGPLDYVCRNPIGLGCAAIHQSCGPSGGGRSCCPGMGTHCEFTTAGLFECIP